MNERLKQQIALLPDNPGVYLMKNKEDKIIYVGKAKNLKKRVSQYFLRPQNGKVAAMVFRVDHFDTIITGSEKEALILEMNLIQKHYPRYNIMLKDGSHYPYIALRKSGDPYLRIMRSNKDPQYRYFGPYPNSHSAYEVVDLLNGIEDFLNGKDSEIRAQIKEKMIRAADDLQFETANEYKNTLTAIDHIRSKQTVEMSEKVDRDIFAYALRDGYLALAVLLFRRGMMLGKELFVVEEFGDLDEQMTDLIIQFYQTHPQPKEILIADRSIAKLIEDYLSIKTVVPRQGNKLNLITMASKNAQKGLDEHFMTARLQDDKAGLLDQLGEMLNMQTPYHIELFDNSNLQGSSAVGAMVAFINGEPVKKMYRKFHIEQEGKNDDYGSMKEIIYRRYSRQVEEEQALPDLLIVDGGLGQIHAAEESLNQLGLRIPIAGLFKNDKHQTRGLLTQDGEVLALDIKSPLFFLLMRMQDEVH
ncbi:MAG: excinuclease ABC subunit UvrC, partial [Methanomicrobia archaeon]|nr:excinuclease ABC subunit UvrC [Methanomicrobia archaeon]